MAYTPATWTPTDFVTAAKLNHMEGGIAAALEANQGSANAGKFLVVGNDGTVAPVEIPAASGVSF